VACYDLGKLLTGSQGTLGLITEATFRLHPQPTAVAFVTAEFGPGERAGAVAAVGSAAASPLVPSAVELDWPGGSQRMLRVGVLLEGTAPGVAERAKRMSELLSSAGGSVAVSEAAPARWGTLPAAAAVVRVSFWVSALGSVLEALVSAEAEAGVRAAVSGPAGAGALYACLDPDASDEAAVRFAAALRGRLATASGAAPRGSVVVLVAPPPVLAAADASGSLPGAALMRAVKDQFDPDHRMFPGRSAFAGGD
jgi:glycolate oxidase FAD binding subunit